MPLHWFSLPAGTGTKKPPSFRVICRTGSTKARKSVATAASVHKRPKTVYLYRLRRSKRVHGLWRKLSRRQSIKTIRSVPSLPASTTVEQATQRASKHESIPSIIQTSPSQKRLTIHEGPSSSPAEGMREPKKKSIRFSHPTAQGMISPALPSATTIAEEGPSVWTDNPATENRSSPTSSVSHLPGVNPDTIRRSYLETMRNSYRLPETENQTLNRLDGTLKRGYRQPNREARPPTLEYLSRTPSIGKPLTQALHQCHGAGTPVLQDPQHALEVLACQKQTGPDLSECPQWLKDKFGPSEATTKSKRESYYPGQVEYRASYVAYNPTRDYEIPPAPQQTQVQSQLRPVSQLEQQGKGKGAADRHIADNLDQVRELEHYEALTSEKQHGTTRRAESPPPSEHLPVALCPAGQRIPRKPVRASRLNHPLPPAPQTQPNQPASQPRSTRPDAPLPLTSYNLAQSAARAASLKHEHSSRSQRSAKKQHPFAECGCTCDCNHCYAAHLYARMANGPANEHANGRCHCDCLPCLAAHAPHRVPGLSPDTSGSGRRRKRDLVAAIATKDSGGVQKFLGGSR